MGYREPTLWEQIVGVGFATWAFAALASTLGVCLVEVCDVLSERDRPLPAWPPVVAAVLVSVAVVSATILVAGGTAQQVLCPDGLVNCVGAAG